MCWRAPDSHKLESGLSSRMASPVHSVPGGTWFCTVKVSSRGRKWDTGAKSCEPEDRPSVAHEEEIATRLVTSRGRFEERSTDRIRESTVVLGE
jgi:hypothetical protein